MKSVLALRARSLTIFLTGVFCGVAYLISCGKVNTNEAGATGTTTRYVKANGTSIGEFVSMVNALYQGSSAQSEKVMVTISSTGFLIPVRRDGAIDRDHIYFTAVDCGGTAYTRFAVPKSVFRNGNDIWYVSSSAIETSVSYESYKSSDLGSCSNSSGTHDSVIEVIANNPTVTAVSVNGFTAPITIE